MSVLILPAVGELGPGAHNKITTALLTLEDLIGASGGGTVVPASGFTLAGIVTAANTAAAAGGGCVYVGPGEWNCDAGTLDSQMTHRRNVRITGAGPFATILRKRTTGICVELTGWGQEVSNLQIDGSTTRSVTMTTTSGSRTVTAISPALTQADVGAFLTGSGVADLAIQHVDPAGTSAVLIAPATATGTGIAVTLEVKGCTTGILVRGRSVATPSYDPVRMLDLHDLYITGCREAVRFGHYSTLNGITGDAGDADISGGNYERIWVEKCDYGWIEDGQNILLHAVHSLWMNSITYNHTLQPRGGQVHVEAGYFGPTIGAPQTTIASGSNGAALPQATINVASTTTFPVAGTATVVSSGGEQQVTYTGITGTTLTGCEGGTGTMSTGALVRSNGYPKADVGAYNAIFKDVRSENLEGPTAQPPAILSRPGNGTSHVVAEACYWTNLATAPLTMVDVMMMGGTLVQIQCVASGQCMLNNTDYFGVGNEMFGGYRRGASQPARSETIYDYNGPSRVSNGLGKTRMGNDPPTTAFSPTSAVVIGGSTVDSALALVGPSAPLLGFHLSSSAPQRGAIFVFGTGADGGLMVLQTKPTGGALRDAVHLHDTIANGETVASLLVNVGGVYTMQRVTLGAADSGGTGFKALRVPN